MKHICIPLAVALTVAAVSCSHKDKSDKQSAGEPTAMSVTEVIEDSVMVTKNYPGMLVADNTVNVVGQVNGHITSVHVSGGEYVRKGQVLFTIDPTLYANAVAEAQAALNTARADYEYAEEHYNAVSRALASNAVSKMEVSQAKSDRDQALSQINNAKASLATAQTRLGYCTVTAPISGHISSNMLSQGSYVAGEASPVTLATIYDDSKVKVKFSIDDDIYETIANGTLLTGDYDHIPVTFSEPMPHSYTGKLYYMEPAIDPSTGTMQIEAKIDNPYNELRSGMYATVSIPYVTRPHALLVYEASVGTDQRGRYMYTVGDSSQIVYTPVTVGEAVGDSLCIITSGLKPGQFYVTEALLKARPGQKIKALKQTPPAKPSQSTAGLPSSQTK